MKKLILSVFLLLGFATSSMLVGQVASQLAVLAKMDGDFNAYETYGQEIATIKKQLQAQVVDMSQDGSDFKGSPSVDPRQAMTTFNNLLLK